MVDLTLRQQLNMRLGQLKTERASWVAHWQDITTHLLPRSGRYFVQDRNRGDKRHNNIYDNTATRAHRILAAGMMAGMTSPARPWFRLAAHDPELSKYAPVKQWLSDVTNIMLRVFHASNTYRSLHTIYEELGAFGTAASILSRDFDDVVRHTPLTAGEYYIATDHRGQVCTIYRNFDMTVAQMVRDFGRDACSNTVKNMFDRGALDRWVTVVHVIEPRADRDAKKRDAKNMPWRSVYYEQGADANDVLRESGYKRFSALCPRWSVGGGDVYGNSPAMDALGDVRQLQHQQLRKAQGIDYLVKPPLQVPTSMRGAGVETMPGGITYIDTAGPNNGIRTAFEARIDLSHLLADIQDVRERIKGAFYADLFLMLANQTDTRMTATEVAERHEEKMLMLGPVLERLQNELLQPLIDYTFDQLIEARVVPPPPQELVGQELNVEFVSMLAQAQRAIGTNSIDRFVGTLGTVAQFKPDVLDKFDADNWADAYSDMLGVDPSLVVASDKVAIIRDQRAQQQNALQQSATINAAADSAAKLGTVRTDQRNAATDVMQMFTGYGSK